MKYLAQRILLTRDEMKREKKRCEKITQTLRDKDVRNYHELEEKRKQSQKKIEFLKDDLALLKRELEEVFSKEQVDDYMQKLIENTYINDNRKSVSDSNQRTVRRFLCRVIHLMGEAYEK